MLLLNRARIWKGIAEYQYTGRKRPVIAYLLLTNRCNLNCRYCFVDVNKIQKDDMTLEEWKACLDDLWKAGGRSVTLMGGEALMAEGVDELIYYAKDLGFNVEMTTNGYLIDKHKDAISKLDAVMISIDGSKPDVNDLNRGKGSHRKAVEAIKKIKSWGVPVRANCVVTKTNYNDLDEILDMADELDVWITLSLTADFPEEQKELESELMLSREEVVNYHKRALEHKRNGRKILFSEMGLQYVIDYPLDYQEITLRDGPQKPKDTCLFGQTFVYINSNGDIYPCATLWNSPHFKPANLRTIGLQAALDVASNLPCKSCFCPGVPEWKRVTTIPGIIDGAKATISQIASAK
jgi:MoaA/NifB/PqqE/SkfB family radical SAM enzyme